MSEAFERIVDEITKHENDGFRVTGLEVPPDVFDSLVSDSNFISATQSDFDDTPRVCGKEIHINPDISDVVASDIERK